MSRERASPASPPPSTASRNVARQQSYLRCPGKRSSVIELQDTLKKAASKERCCCMAAVHLGGRCCSSTVKLQFFNCKAVLSASNPPKGYGRFPHSLFLQSNQRGCPITSQCLCSEISGLRPRTGLGGWLQHPTKSAGNQELLLLMNRFKTHRPKKYSTEVALLTSGTMPSLPFSSGALDCGFNHAMLYLMHASRRPVPATRARHPVSSHMSTF
jgi:hypothetical protein